MVDLRKLKGGMLVLTVFGALLMLPPLVHVFNHPIAHFGIPQIVFYLFAVWLLLIVATALLAHAVPADEAEAEPGEGDR
jgi:hypothetical protein